MSFSDFKAVQKVAEKYKIITLKNDLLTVIPDLDLSTNFIDNNITINNPTKYSSMNM